MRTPACPCRHVSLFARSFYTVVYEAAITAIKALFPSGGMMNPKMYTEELLSTATNALNDALATAKALEDSVITSQATWHVYFRSIGFEWPFVSTGTHL